MANDARFLSKTGLSTVWATIKSTFVKNVSGNNTQTTIKSPSNTAYAAQISVSDTNTSMWSHNDSKNAIVEVRKNNAEKGEIYLKADLAEIILTPIKLQQFSNWFEKLTSTVVTDIITVVNSIKNTVGLSRLESTLDVFYYSTSDGKLHSETSLLVEGSIEDEDGNKLANKADKTHNHNGVYAASDHNHDSSYIKMDSIIKYGNCSTDSRYVLDTNKMCTYVLKTSSSESRGFTLESLITSPSGYTKIFRSGDSSKVVSFGKTFILRSYTITSGVSSGTIYVIFDGEF